MDQKGSGRKAKARRESEEEETPVSPLSMTAEAPVLPEELRDEMTNLIQQLLLQAHELAFEYALSNCEELLDCPLAQKAKSLFKIIKQLNDLVREGLSPSSKPTYAR